MLTSHNKLSCGAISIRWTSVISDFSPSTTGNSTIMSLYDSNVGIDKNVANELKG